MNEVILIDGVKEYILKSEADRAHRILADRLKEVRAQCDNLQAENERLRKSLDGANARTNDWSSAAVAWKSECDNLQAENERLKEQLRQALTEWET